MRGVVGLFAVGGVLALWGGVLGEWAGRPEGALGFVWWMGLR